MQSLFYYKTQEEIFNKLKLDKRGLILEKQVPRKIMGYLLRNSDD